MISSRKKLNIPGVVFCCFSLSCQKKKRPKKAGTLIVGLVGHFEKKKTVGWFVGSCFPNQKRKTKKNTRHTLTAVFFPEAENRPSEARAISMGELVEEFLMFNRLREGFFVGGVWIMVLIK